MRSVLIFALLLSLGGCATMEGVTPFKGAQDTENLHEKERRLWHEAAGYDNTIERSGQLYEHARATRYVQGVMDGLYPEFKGKIPVRIYDSTQLNAFALPNGSVYINIGMLARIENEAQLAAVLGHEAVHFIEKHSFQERVSSKNAASFAVSGIPFASLAAASSISGFSRELEREADAMGYQRLVKAGYDPREAHKVFQYLADEVKALDIKEPYFFSSHPKMIDRIEQFKRMSAQHKGGGRTGSEQYNSIMSEIRLDALRKDIGQDRYKSVILVMEDSKLKGYYPAAGYFYLGEAYSRRDETGDEGKAIEAYKKAEKMSPKFAPTYMRLGMHYMKKGNKGNARNYFNRYLSLAPKDASDRGYVQQYLNSL
jgi:beta-barrel assembly-enhancing protease